MILTFEISATCSVSGADRKPNEQEITKAIETVLENELGLISTVYVRNLREEQ